MRWTRRLLFALALVTLVAFPFGPLFPWSPVKPGYDVIRLQRADIVHPTGVPPDPAYLQLDEYISEIEAFQGLQMPNRIQVIACRSWTDFERFMPQYRSRVVGGVTLMTGTVIYVTPKLRERNLDTGEFLRHELSHAALNQNQSWRHAFEIAQVQWFSEGLAVLAGRQKAYISAAEFTERARQRDMTPLFDGSPQADMRLAYQAWRYFLAWTIETQGRDRFLDLERGCIDDPRGCGSVFAKVYGLPLADRVREFQKAVQGGQFEPTD